MADITVVRDDEASRYEIMADGVPAGFATFDVRPGSIRFLHTEVDSAFQGQGIAGKLASSALTDAAHEGRRSFRSALTSPSTSKHMRSLARRFAGQRRPHPRPDSRFVASKLKVWPEPLSYRRAFCLSARRSGSRPESLAVSLAG